MGDPYVLLKWLHVLGAVVLFGTGLGTAFHLWFANRSGDARVIAAAAHSTVIADYAFTAPAAMLQPITGLALANAAGYPLGSAWIVAAFALYLLAGACWIPVVFIQLRLRDLARESARDATPLPPAYRKLWNAWLALGWPAFIALAVAVWLMIARPT